MKVDILYITYNRLDSTKLTLPRLLHSTEYPFNLTVVDNGSNDNTVDYLTEMVREYHLRKPMKLILNRVNEGLSKPTNRFWRESKADLVGKIDNDILVENGWFEKLINAHKTVHDLAIIGGFHFPKGVFDYDKCKHNIYQYDDIRILRQPYIGGNYIAKRKFLMEKGFLEEASDEGQFRLGGWTGYQKQLSASRYIIGYYYPLIFFKHLNDFHDKYFKEVRGVSRRKYMKWEKKDGKRLLNTKWNWGE
jgi:glycosyltransferase involved in cell wall biosynthesis